MKSNFFRNVKVITQVFGVATVSFGVVLNGLADLNERQNKHRNPNSKEKMRWSPKGIGGVFSKKEVVVDVKPTKDAVKVDVPNR